MRDKKPGDKIFSDLFTLKSDIGNPILRQTPILGDNTPAAPVTWVEKGILRNLAGGPNGRARTSNMSLVQEGSGAVDRRHGEADAPRPARDVLLVHPRRADNATAAQHRHDARRAVPHRERRDRLGPVQNFRWNMSPLVGYNNLSLVGKPVPMHTGESYDGGGTALVPPVRIEDFYMTSVSPAV